MKKLLYALPILLLGVLAGVLIAGLDRDPRAAPLSQIGKPMPEFELPPLPGHAKGLSRADLAGRPAVINLFASWCGYCRAEHAGLLALAKETQVPIYGIAWRDDPKQTEKYLNDLGNPYAAIGMDRKGRGVIAWGITGTPETFVIDGQGIIRYHVAGPMLGDEIEKTIKPLLAGLK